MSGLFCFTSRKACTAKQVSQSWDPLVPCAQWKWQNTLIAGQMHGTSMLAKFTGFHGSFGAHLFFPTYLHFKKAPLIAKSSFSTLSLWKAEHLNLLYTSALGWNILKVKFSTVSMQVHNCNLTFNRSREQILTCIFMPSKPNLEHTEPTVSLHEYDTEVTPDPDQWWRRSLF